MTSEARSFIPFARPDMAPGRFTLEPWERRDASGAPGSLARIVRVEPRASILRRTADDTDPIERAIVANVDQLVVVSALANPEPRPRLIDRCLVAAYDADLDPLLAKLAQYRESEERIGLCDEFQIHVISIDGFTVDGVKRLEDKGVTDVIVGFRVPYIMGQDTQPLDEKIKHLEMFAENVIAKV